LYAFGRMGLDTAACVAGDNRIVKSIRASPYEIDR
jgi:hypothetical protein